MDDRISYGNQQTRAAGYLPASGLFVLSNLFLKIMPFLVGIAVVVASFAMVEARAASFADQASGALGHCAAMAEMGHDDPDPHHDSDLPMSDDMNCAISCAFIVAASLGVLTADQLFAQDHVAILEVAFAGLDGQLDPPPPKA